MKPNEQQAPERTIDRLHRETGTPMWALEIAFELSTLGMLDEETMAGNRVIPDAAKVIAESLLQQPASERCGECGHDPRAYFNAEMSQCVRYDTETQRICGCRCVFPATGGPNCSADVCAEMAAEYEAKDADYRKQWGHPVPPSIDGRIATVLREAEKRIRATTGTGTVQPPAAPQATQVAANDVQEELNEERRRLIQLAAEVSRLRVELTTARADAIRECVDAVSNRTGGHTIDIVTGRLLPDTDGPWFLKWEIAAALESLTKKE